MKQVSVLLMFCFFAGSEAFFLDWFKSKKPQGYSSGAAYYPPPRPSSSYSYYRPQYKVPVWQTLPSGYPARPVQQGGGNYADTAYGSYGNGVSGNYGGGGGGGGNYGTAGYGSNYGTAGYTGGTNYGTAGYGSSYGMPSNIGGGGGGSYDTGSYGGGGVQSPPNYLPSAGNYNQGGGGGGYSPVYEVTAPVYGGEAGNINVPATGNTDYTGNKPLLSVPVYFPKGTSGTTYSNGVSGFYDGTVDASNSIGYVQPAGQQ